MRRGLRSCPGLVSVAAERERDTLRVLVRDDGPGVAPRTDSPGRGLRLTIIAGVTEAMELRTRPEGGAELSMVFRLAYADAAPTPDLLRTIAAG